MESAPVIRIFPHKDWFPKGEDLRTWLHFTLRTRGGFYFFRKTPVSMTDQNPPGSVVLFRHKDSIVGEAVVKHDVMRSNVPAYDGMIQFEPTSIRIFKVPLRVKRLSSLTGVDLANDGAYTKIPMSAYGYVLNEAITAAAGKTDDGKTGPEPLPDTPVIRVFPHKDLFPEQEDLKGWLHFTVRERGGFYYFSKVPSVMKNESTPRGSIVLFKMGDEIVSEAVVSSDIGPSNVKEYPSMIQFDPLSIRAFRHPLHVPRLERILDTTLSEPGVYYKLPVASYGDILNEAITYGFA